MATALDRFPSLLRPAAIAGLLLAIVFLAAPDVVAQRGMAQHQTPDVRSVSPESQLAAAINLVRADQSDASVPLLRGIVTDRATYVSSTHGSAAYWLGTALERSGDSDAAYRTWRDAVRAMRDRNAFDIQLAHAFIQTLTPVRLRNDRSLALTTYGSIISSFGTAANETERSIQRQYAAELAPLMTQEHVSNMINESPDTDAESWTFPPDAGDFVSAWWNQLDPMPVTAENERIEEHLGRRAYALQEYGCDERVSGLDDRGLVFLRFGAPGRTHVIDYQDPEFRREVFRFGVSVTPREFPDNELWSYASLSDAGYYIFTENSDQCYEISGAMDLLPSRLHQNRGATERAENISYSALMALRYIFSELSLFHIDFAAAFSEISSYAIFQENQALSVEARSRLSGDRSNAEGEGAGMESQTVGAGFGQTRTVSSSANFGIDSPSGFISSIVTSLNHQDNAARHRRKNLMPRQATEIFQQQESIPIALRTARFLNTDGSTRTEIYWGIQKRHLRSKDRPQQPSVLTFDAVQYDGELSASGRAERRHLLTAQSLNGNSIFVSPPVSVNSRSDLFHIGLQWSQFAVNSEDPNNASLGDRVRYTTLRADSLRPIDATPNQVAMSDLRVMVSQTGSVSDAVAFPFSTIGPDTPLILYFELYHLTYDADDRTRYKVAYEVEGRTQRGWTRVFRNDEVRRTSTEAEYSSTARRTQEYIYLDLSKLRDKKNQDVRVTVRVTDTVTGATTSRTTAFELVGTDRFD